MAEPIDDLHDIPDPAPHVPGVEIPLWVWFTTAAVLIVLVVAVVLIVRYLERRPPLPTHETIYPRSRKLLEDLKTNSAEQSLPTVATSASLILRDYLAEAFQEPALYETHEEFTLRPDALQTLPSGAQERLRPLLVELTALKYGPAGDLPETRSAPELVDSCLEVLQGVESTRNRTLA